MNALNWAIAILSVIAAGLGLRAATINVENNIDTFIDSLQRQGRWTGGAAVLNAVVALLLLLQQIRAAP
jgi:hypothetical protein